MARLHLALDRFITRLDPILEAVKYVRRAPRRAEGCNSDPKSGEPFEITGGTLKRSEMDYRGHDRSGRGRTQSRRDLS
jgi:hypothetical protein